MTSIQIHTKTLYLGTVLGEKFGEENMGSCKDIKRKGTSKLGYLFSFILCIEQTNSQKIAPQ